MNAKVVAFLLVVATICAEIPLSSKFQVLFVTKTKTPFVNDV